MTNMHVGTQKLTDLLERVGATFAFVFLSTVLIVDRGHSISWLHALDVAAFAALICLLTTVVVVWLVGLHLVNPFADLFVRAVLTFVQALLASMAAAGSAGFLTFNWNTALEAAITAAGLLALKGFAGMANADTAGASVAVRRPQRLVSRQGASHEAHAA